MATSFANCTPALLQISDISIDFSKSGKTIKRAELHMSGVQKLIPPSRSNVGNSKNLQGIFVPPLYLSEGDQFSLRLFYSGRLTRNNLEDVDFDTGDMFSACSGVRKRHEYYKLHGGIAIVVKLRGQQSVDFSEEILDLYPTTDDIFSICPRFRILVIGKTGVGKSSLIDRAFGVQNILGQGGRPGKASIDTGFISQHNDKFVLHDSKGFEPGDGDNVKIVREFIERRRHMADFRDRVHAIWLCFEIPRAGGRFLETVTEDFLKLKDDGELGNIPVVVVLTKYDEFIVHVERMLDGSLEGLSDDAVNKLVKQKADTKLRDMCTLPLERFAGSDIPYATVSTKEVHKEMVAPLIQITEERIRQHVIKEITFKRNTKACFHYKQYFSDLSSTFENDAFLHSGRFRILVIGKTGVGKCTLINRAFGVKKTLASDSTPGEATIDTEFISVQNDRLVFHGSKGFDPGEEGNVKIVQDFIERRRKKAVLGDRLHAVWLCLEIPRAGGRLLETGTEDFLRLKHDGELGNIPVVVVLTKYDKFIDHVDHTFDDSGLGGLSDDAVKELIKQKADAELRVMCTLPLQRFAGEDIPYAAVSNNKVHKEMIANLIQITKDYVCQHVASEASTILSIAQCVDPKSKIKMSIEVSKRRYRKVLVSTAAFEGNMVKEVLHIDIVRVWNFSDPEGYLDSEEFKNLMVNLVDKVDVGSSVNLNRNMLVGLSKAAAIARTVSALPGPAAPIVAPIAASVVLAKWVLDMYKISRAPYFVAYIVDLTLVLQTLYLLCDSQELTRRSIKLAMKSYLESDVYVRIHYRIKKHDGDLPLSETLDMIAKLMDECSIDVSEISGLRACIPLFGSVPDERGEVAYDEDNVAYGLGYTTNG